MGDAQHIATIAADLIRRFGDEAETMATARAANCKVDGDDEDALLWRRVARAVRGIRSQRAPIGVARRTIPNRTATVMVDAHFRRIFEAMPHAYLLLTGDLEIAGANAAYLTATMSAPEEILGRQVFEAFPESPELTNAAGAASLKRSVAQVLDTGRADAMTVQRYDVRSSGGLFEARWWQAVNVPAFDEDGKLLLVIHNVRDVTSHMTAGTGRGQAPDAAVNTAN